MYNFALCDDDTDFCNEFKDRLAAILAGKAIRYELTCFDSAEKFLAALDGGRFDLIFLDIMLGDTNGMDIAKAIREKNYGCDIVFISSYRDFAFDSYDVRPLHYLDKSPGIGRLEEALNRFLEKSSGATIYLTNSRGALALNLADILYFEVFGHDLTIHKSDGTKLRYSGTLKDMEDMLPPSLFVRTQRSFLVNLGHVKEITRHEVILTDGESVSIGRGKYDTVRLRFLDYVAKKNAFG